MGLFTQVLKVGLDVVTLPVDIVKDTVTLGGSLTDEESAIGSKIGKIVDDVNDLPDSVDDGII